MENQDGIRGIKNLSAKEGTGTVTATEIGIALNTLAREQMIRRLLNDILIDLNVCRIEGLDPKEYITRLKAEIDNTFEFLENNRRKDGENGTGND